VTRHYVCLCILHPLSIEGSLWALPNNDEHTTFHYDQIYNLRNDVISAFKQYISQERREFISNTGFTYDFVHPLIFILSQGQRTVIRRSHNRQLIVSTPTTTPASGSSKRTHFLHLNSQMNFQCPLDLGSSNKCTDNIYLYTSLTKRDKINDTNAMCEFVPPPHSSTTRLLDTYELNATIAHNTCTKTAYCQSYKNPLVQNKSFSYNTPTRNPRPNSTTTASIQRKLSKNHDNYINSSTHDSYNSNGRQWAVKPMPPYIHHV